MNATESGSDRQFTGRDTSRKRLLRAVAAQTAALSAAVHFLWAWPRLAEPADARPYVFLLGGAFTVAIAVATLRADEYRRLYALGAGTLAAFLAGYAGWHGGGTAAALASDPLAIVAKGAEVVGVAAFLALYRLAPPTSVVVERQEEAESGEEEATNGGEAIGDTTASNDEDARA
ncbi:hypothetical protein [Halorubrum lacusprofundi]|jgi:rhodanese-related sulfurtransferase|uniref:Uncharacterized protein n=1 Tax=Halorubrum lacusprofundi (strain ATCC 49239 / DSM 5036 / JCM 8891 / ACAM 34) TaxID=416348 RepID=B9LQ77_HALLT|nr:hypothetical protein [Halorubrum lacusprofundi]ACM55611.1 hypothetical protein Hlac_0005 [Halorubrum lacusprofundi ATCC 49239]